MTDTALTTLATPSLPEMATFDQWVDTGRSLASMRKRLGFLIGDWVNHGRTHFAEQIEMALEVAGLDGKFATRAANVARSFPPAIRNEALSFDHHRAVLTLPREEQLELLREAGKQRWKPQELRDAVAQRRYERGQDFPDDDVDAHTEVQIIRAWNRATPAARESFAERVAVAGTGVIDEDRVYD